MATHPLVLLVEPDPMLRELIHAELKSEGCVVVDTTNGDEALSFAELYPGPIDHAVTDLALPEHNARFARALRSLPTGAGARVSCLPELFDRNDLIESLGLEAQPEEGDGAVFWGALQHDSGAANLRPAANG